MQSPRRVSRSQVHDEHRPSLPRVPAVQVPLLHRYDEDVRFPACLSPRFVVLRLAIPRVASVASLAQPRTHDCEPGVGLRYPLAGIRAWKGSGRPKFLGDPRVLMPSSSTPAGPDTPCHGGVPMLPPCCQKRRLLRVVLSRLNGPALALAVYASSGGLPAPGRKTRFWLLARLYQVGLVTHRIPTKGFEVYPLHLLLLSQALLGAMT